MRNLSHIYKWNAYYIQVIFVTIFGFILSTILSFLLLPGFIILLTIYGIVYARLKLKYGRKVCRVDGGDILYAIDRKETNPYFNCIIRFEGDLTADDCIKIYYNKFIERLEVPDSKLRRFWQIKIKKWGYYFFKDVDHFKEKFFSRVIEVKKKDIWEGESDGFSFLKKKSSEEDNSYEEFVKDEFQIISQRMTELFGAKPIVNNESLWEAYCYKEGKQYVTVLFHCHHAMTDGMNGMRFFMEELPDVPLKYDFPFNFYQTNSFLRCLSIFYAFALIPYGLWRLTKSFAKSPLHGPKLSGDKLFVTTREIPLHKFKDVKKKANVSMSCLLLSCFSYAFRKHYERAGVYVPKTLAGVPVPFQDFSKPLKFANRFAVQGAVLSTGLRNLVDDTPMERLREVERLLYVSVRDQAFLPHFWSMKLLGGILPAFIMKKLLEYRHVTTIFSNLIGPQDQPYTICDGKASSSSMMFWVPDISPVGMGVSTMGHRGHLRVGLLIDKALINNYKEAYMFLEGFIEELENLRRDLKINKEEV